MGSDQRATRSRVQDRTCKPASSHSSGLWGQEVEYHWSISIFCFLGLMSMTWSRPGTATQWSHFSHFLGSTMRLPHSHYNPYKTDASPFFVPWLTCCILPLSLPDGAVSRCSHTVFQHCLQLYCFSQATSVTPSTQAAPSSSSSPALPTAFVPEPSPCPISVLSPDSPCVILSLLDAS